MSNEEQEAIFDSSKEIKWGGWLNEFLWVCAGVNRKVLRQCPTDYAKYAGIGGTILFTALMACLSGGYALSFVFDNDAVGVAFGIFWGMLIFNLDRFIVNTMYSDGKVTISARELKAGLPRIIMAIFLGIVISYPLELRLFDDEIKIKISDMKKQRLSDRVAVDNAKIDSLKHLAQSLRDNPPTLNGNDIVLGNEQLVDLQKKLADETAHLNQAQQRVNALVVLIHTLKSSNVDGKNDRQLTSKNSELTQSTIERNRYRNNVNDLQLQMSRLSPQITAKINERQKKIDDEINRVMAECDTLELKTKNAAANYTEELKDFNGLQAQMLAFSEIKDKNMSTQIASILIMLLFIIIETAPTFFKMMIASGPYDDLLRAEMHRVRVLSDKRISDINDEVNTSVEISVAKNKERLEAEMAANKEVLTQVAVAQARLIEYAIKEWEKVERTKIEKDPSAYIRGFEPTVEVSSNRAKKGKKHRGRKVEQSVPTEIHGRESETSTEPEAVDEPENTIEPQPGNE